MKKILIVLTFIVFTSTGCSVFMAMSGKKEPNLAVLTTGQDRGLVILNLGNPVQTYVKDDMTVDTYEVQFGNEPSGGRAIAHAAMDVLTWGAWEIVGTPVEGMQGKTQTITVEYDKNNKLVSVNTVSGHIQKENSTEKTSDQKSEKETVSQPTTNFTHK